MNDKAVHLMKQMLDTPSPAGFEMKLQRRSGAK